ncbi:ATP-binding protein [Streptomyces sp. NPDC057540]|uniref:ATP-binding protein n=1 Tax=Streptomyces sp. NPDC057540 TaxID=3346160 RepID=UPI003673E51A
MTSNIDNPTGTTQPTGVSPYLGRGVFTLRFTSTARGARLARRLVAVRLDEWGVPFGTPAHDTVVLVAAELTANAVRHGHVPGRDFELLLRLLHGVTAVARIEVGDTRGERLPTRPGPLPEGELGEGGRGLLLVERLADRWGWYPRAGGPGKTVWAECALP